jgi:YggT family protein
MPSDLGGLVALILRLLSFAIIGRALLSWFDPGMNSTVGRLLFDLTEPIIAPIRRVVPSIGAFDLSPIIALLLINFLGGQLVRAL